MEIKTILWKSIIIDHLNKDKKDVYSNCHLRSDDKFLSITEYKEFNDSNRQVVLGDPIFVKMTSSSIEFEAIWFDENSKHKVKIYGEF